MRSSEVSTSVSGRATCNCCARTVREREDAQIRAVHRHVLPERCASLTRDGENVVADRDLELLPRRDENRSVGLDELHVAARLTELGADREIFLAALPGENAKRLE